MDLKVQVKLIRYLILWVSNMVFAIDTYHIRGDSGICVKQHENLLHIQSHYKIILAEQPKYSQQSYIVDTTGNDILLVLKKHVYYIVKESSQGVSVTIYDENEWTEKITLMIDPGHGGKDPGAISAKGVKEKDVALSFSKRLMEQLEQDGLFQVSMLRDQDISLDKYTRLEKVLVEKPEYLISIHADAYTHASAEGFGVFCLDNSQGSINSQNLLSKYAKGVDKNVKSKAKSLAGSILNYLNRDYALHSPIPGSQPLVILRSPYTISILLELGFLSNVKEAALLSNDEYLAHLSNDIIAGFKQYIYQDNHIIAFGRVN